jgi:xylulokinase
MTSLLLGIDIGTTATKAVLIDEKGKVLSQGRAEHPISHLKDNWVEQNPLDWWQSLTVATNIALKDLNGRSIAGVAVSAQAPTLIAVDAMGIPLRPAMIWMDRRADKEAVDLLQKVPNIFELTGNRSDPFYLASKISWFIKNENELYKNTKYFLQITGFVNFKLTGKFGLDRAHASLLQLLNTNQEGWNKEVCEAVGVDVSKFPEIQNCDALLGEVTPAAQTTTGIPSGTPVFFGSVDGASAALESGAIDPGTVAEMTGTSTVLIIPTDGNIRCKSFISMSHSVLGRHLQLGAMVSSGASIQWFQEKILGNSISIEDLVSGAKEIEPGSGGVIFLPYMMGERAPIWNSNARGVFFGLSLTTTPFSLFRAILEGTSFALAHNVEVAREAGLVIEEIRSIGGGSKNMLWNQIKADIVGVPILTLAESAGAPIGNAFIAGYGAGIITDIRRAIEKSIIIDKRFEPNPQTHSFYTARYKEFRNLYESLKDGFVNSALTASFDGVR